MTQRIALLLCFLAGFAGGYCGKHLGPSSKSTLSGSVENRSAAVASEPATLQEPPTVQGHLEVMQGWPRLESTNYLEYISKLRLIGCPEDVIADIIRGEVELAYAPRIAALRARQSPMNQFQQARRQMKELSEISREMDDLLYNKLGVKRPAPLDGAFSANQEERIQEASTLYPVVRPDPSNPESLTDALNNRKARIDFLSNVLSPSELLDYRLLREGDADKVQSVLRGMQPTKEEFFRVYEAIQDSLQEARTGRFSADVEDRLSMALGPDRYALLQELRQEHYLGIYVFCEFNRLPQTTVGKLVEIRRTLLPTSPDRYREEVIKILRSPRLADEYFQDQIIHQERRKP